MSYNQFEELMDIEVMQKRLDFIKTMQDSLTFVDSNGEERNFFSSRFLAEKYLKMSHADFMLNEKYRKQESENVSENEDDESDDNNDFNGSGDDFGSGNSGFTELSNDLSDEEASGPSDDEQSDFDQPI